MSIMLNKKDIELIAEKIITVLKKNNLAEGVCLYFNDKRITCHKEYDPLTKTSIYYEKVEENINPHNYLKYCAYNHILSMSFEGPLYDILNYNPGEFPKILENLFKKYEIYYEFGESWNLSFYPIDDKMQVEYTVYKKPEEAITLYYQKRNEYPEEIKAVMEAWYALSKKTGDIGGCVLGASLDFEFKGKNYRMIPCSPYQGEGSWAPYIEVISNLLRCLGATIINWNPGVLD